MRTADLRLKRKRDEGQTERASERVSDSNSTPMAVEAEGVGGSSGSADLPLLASSVVGKGLCAPDDIDVGAFGPLFDLADIEGPVEDDVPAPDIVESLECSNPRRSRGPF